MRRILWLVLLGVAAPLSAQDVAYTLGAHADLGVPTGNDLQPAAAGFGFGAEAVAHFTPLLGIYAGYSLYSFGTDVFNPDGESGYDERGFELGANINIPVGGRLFSPWVTGGAVLRTMEVSYNDPGGEVSSTSNRALGFEVGAGLDIPLTEGGLMLRPAARYRAYPATVEGGELDITYFTFGVGLSYAFYPTYP